MSEDIVESKRAGDERNERLREAVLGLRSRGGGRRPDRMLMIAGAALMGIGLPVILLGWWGASRTPYVFEQVPYLISGGLFGLGLAVVGGLCYFAYWVARQMEETKRQAADTLSALKRIETVLTTGPGRASSNGGFVMTASGTMFHRPDCVVVAGKPGIKPVPASKVGSLEPCRICDPLGEVNPREHAGAN